jgi:GTPase SAR1 family protein
VKNNASLQGTLFDLRQVLAEMGSDFAGLKARTEELCDRLDEGSFRLAVLGQFKRGKSSLLNALLGEPLLPSGVLPVTAIPTILRYGPERRLRVTRQDGGSEEHTGPVELIAKELMHVVTERENPGNRLGVSRVEVEHPGPLLSKAVEIIDTPGIGSTVLHNTRTAKEVLPSCDGALFVLSPDPPITDVELQFLRAVKEAVARVIFVLTKADLLRPAERQELLPFMRRVLQEQAGFSGGERIFVVSAQQALEARSNASAATWAQSGLGELEAHLADFLITGKRAALREAIRSKAVRLTGEALFSLDLQRKTLDLPRQDLRRRCDRFGAQLAKFEQEKVYFRDRLAGDRQRLLEDLDGRAEQLAAQAREAMQTCLRTSREQAGEGRAFERTARAALSAEVERIFGPAAVELPVAAAESFQRIQEDHCRHLETLIDQVRRTAADLFEVPCPEGVQLERLDTHREARMFHHRWVTSFTEEAASWLIRLLPSVVRLPLLDRKLQEEMTYLVARNVEELRWATRQDLEEAFRTFQARMAAQLETTIASIRTAVTTVSERQARRESETGPELRRLESPRQQLAEILGRLSPDSRASLQAGPI